MNNINIELEIKRIARVFAEKQNLKIEVFFKPEGKKYQAEGFMHNGFHDGKTPGLHKLYIKLERNSRALIFRSLAHELAHTGQQEVEGKKYSGEHEALFGQTLDDYTLPFVLENLQSKEDQIALANLLNPTTNQDEEKDGIHLQSNQGVIYFPVEVGDVDQQGKLIRQETIKRNLGQEARVSTKRISQDRYGIYIYIKDNKDKEEVARIMERLMELGFSETEVKVK